MWLTMANHKEEIIDQVDDRVLTLIDQNDLALPILVFFLVLIYQTMVGIVGGINMYNWPEP